MFYGGVCSVLGMTDAHLAYLAFMEILDWDHTEEDAQMKLFTDEQEDS